jgi:hypothetical protein
MKFNARYLVGLIRAHVRRVLRHWRILPAQAGYDAGPRQGRVFVALDGKDG